MSAEPAHAVLPDPASDLAPTAGVGDAFRALVLRDNPLATGVPLERWCAAATPHGRLVCWTGWMDGPARAGERDAFPLDFQTWSPAGWGAFTDFCLGIAPVACEHEVRVCVRPHARHVISDPQRCRAFLKFAAGDLERAHPAAKFELLLDPAAMFTPAMIPDAEDHLGRLFAMVAGHPLVAGVVVAGAEPHPEEDDQLIQTRDGVESPHGLPARLVEDAVRAHAPGLPVVIPAKAP